MPNITLCIIKAKDAKRNAEVLPCPFCGEKEEICLEKYETKVGERWRIFCANCMAGIDRGYDQQPATVISVWNQRIQNEERSCKDV